MPPPIPFALRYTKRFQFRFQQMKVKEKMISDFLKKSEKKPDNKKSQKMPKFRVKLAEKRQKTAFFLEKCTLCP